MSHEAKFQQIWDFRRRDHDGDSSDDSESNPSLEPSDDKPKSDILLLDNDEVKDTPAPQKQETSKGVETVKKKRLLDPVKKKIKPNRKENVVKEKSKRCCSGKEQKKGKQPIKLDDVKEVGMIDDLKNYANSLINELKVARENMFAQMKEETTKMVASRSRSRKRRIARSNQKKKTPPQNGIQSSAKCLGGMIEECIKSEKVTKHDQVLEFKMANKQPFESERGKLVMKSQMHAGNGGNQPVSSHYLALPTVVPAPHSQSHREIIHLDDCALDNQMKQISPGFYYQGVPVMQPGFQSFSQISSNNLGFPDQNFPGMTSESVGFQVPINQDPRSGLDESSNLSSQTYPDYVFQDNPGLRMRMNARFSNGGSGSSSRGIQRNCLSNDVQQNVPFFSQEMKGQCYPGFTGFRNKQ